MGLASLCARATSATAFAAGTPVRVPQRAGLAGAGVRRLHRRESRRRVVCAARGAMSESVRVALCQMPVCADKDTNLSTARAYLSRARERGAALAVLPECFNCPYDTGVFARYAEPAPAPGEAVGADARTAATLRDAARDENLCVVGGSFPEADGGAVYNTSLSFGPDGAVLAKHRKVHLFDVDCSASGGIVFRESDALAAGNSATVFDMPGAGLRVGVGICYDIRFPDLSLAMARRGGVNLLVFPGAFNMTTGPAHWELLARARAVDTQCYVAVCSPARVPGAEGYVPWGHSMLVDPWGAIVASTDAGEDLIVGDINLDRVNEVRGAIPTSIQRREEVYAQPLGK